MKRKRITKHGQRSKAINRSLRGLWMEFSVVDPLAEPNEKVTAKVGSKNPVTNAKLNSGHFWNAMCQVLDNKRLKWRMQIKMEFMRKDGGREFKAHELVAFAALPELEEHYTKVIEDMFSDAQQKNYLDRYVTTHISQEVLDGYEIKESDFSDD